MSHDVHSTLGVSYHGTIGAQSSSHIRVLVLSYQYQVLGTA